MATDIDFAPTSEDELVAVVHQAISAHAPLIALGSGTKRHHGPAAAPNARVVSLRRLNGITSYQPGDLVVSVQAGVKLVDLQRALAERGQWLPLDPPYADATIGGILATASSGPRRLRYGTPKDLLLGLRVIGPRGVATKSGGRVVKNVTGYDLHKLHVGAFGSLGVLVEAHFKVAPRPEVSGAVVLGCADFSTAHRLLLEVAASPLRPAALEALDPGAAADLRASPAVLPDGTALAIVGVEGSALTFDRHVRDLETLAARAQAVAVVRSDEGQRLWAALRDLPERRRTDVSIRIGTRPQALPDLVAPLAGRSDGALAAHVGTGVARLYVSRESASEIPALIASLHAAAAARGGYAVVEAAPLDLDGRAALAWGTTPHGLGALIKKTWDPGGIINPGRMAL